MASIEFCVDKPNQNLNYRYMNECNRITDSAIKHYQTMFSESKRTNFVYEADKGRAKGSQTITPISVTRTWKPSRSIHFTEGYTEGSIVCSYGAQGRSAYLLPFTPHPLTFVSSENVANTGLAFGGNAENFVFIQRTSEEMYILEN